MSPRRNVHKTLLLVIIGLVAVMPPFVNSSYNIALGKPTSQSSVYQEWGADKAVDGIIGKDMVEHGGGSCSSTNATGSPEAWWRVDLQQMSRIKTINVTYRQLYPFRLSGFYLYVSNTTDVDNLPSTGQLCYHDDTTNPDLPKINQYRTCSLNGKYVTFYNKRPADNGPKSHPYYSKTDAVVELCEVQVFGCPVNNFGPNCSRTCHCEFGGCDPENGLCDVTGCQSGWMGPTCSAECGLGTFGVNCGNTCHCSTPGCNKETGNCAVSGCKAGWQGNACDSECGPDRFGENCNHTCHCAVPGCDHFNGRCILTGCEPGWAGLACDIACNITSFGNDCNHTCHCAIPGCERFSGICKVTGCDVGWIGTACETALMKCEDRRTSCETLVPYASLGTLLFIAICTNIGLIIDRLRLKRKRSRSEENEMQNRYSSTDINSYVNLDAAKVEQARDIYDTIRK